DGRLRHPRGLRRPSLRRLAPPRLLPTLGRLRHARRGGVIGLSTRRPGPLPRPIAPTGGARAPHHTCVQRSELSAAFRSLAADPRAIIPAWATSHDHSTARRTSSSASGAPLTTQVHS